MPPPVATVAHERALGPLERSVLAERRRRLLAWAEEPVLDLSRGPGSDVALAALPAASYGSVVSVFGLCSVDDPSTRLAGLRRVLRDDGALLFLEHVPPGGLARDVLRMARPAWAALSAGCDLDRDAVALIRRAGFTVTDIERFEMPTLLLPLRRCAAGRARPHLATDRP